MRGPGVESAHLHLSLDGPLISKVGAVSICIITGASIANIRGVTAVLLLTHEENKPQSTCPRPLSSLSTAAVANDHKPSSFSPFIISASVGLAWLSLCIKSHTEIQEALGEVLLPAQSGH